MFVDYRPSGILPGLQVQGPLRPKVEIIPSAPPQRLFLPFPLLLPPTSLCRLLALLLAPASLCFHLLVFLVVSLPLVVNLLLVVHWES